MAPWYGHAVHADPADADRHACQVLMALPEVFPWVRFLPRDDVRAFLVELVETMHACADLGNVAALDGTDYGEVRES